ncbi:hypothetical protein [Maribacter sp. 2307ULW6-5]|uniref:hypothetical protein n=1 Tax=Maribacter sp. 2307ULW6-5 TaxID=3386275 RepID=UPI0039BD457A
MRFFLKCLLGLFLFLNCTPGQDTEQDLYQLVPPEAILVLHYNDFEALSAELEDNELIASLKKMKGAQKLGKKVAPLDGVAPLSKGLLWFSAPEANAFEYALISADSLLPRPVDSLARSTVRTLEENGLAYSSMVLDSVPIFTATIRGRPVLSSSLALLHQMAATDGQHQKNTGLLRSSAIMDTTKLGHLWIDLERADLLAAQWLGPGPNKGLSQFSSWLSLDIATTNGALLLHGISVAKDSSNTYLNLFRNNKNRLELPKYVPEASHFLKSYGIQDFRGFAQNRKGTAQTVAGDSIYNTTEEVALAQTDRGTLFFLKTFGALNIIEHLKTRQTGSMTFQGMEIMAFDSLPDLTRSFLPLTEGLRLRFAHVMENTIAFSDTAAALEETILARNRETTFDRSGSFNSAQETLTPQATITTIATGKGLAAQLTDSGAPALAAELEQLGMEKQLFGAQFIAEDGYFHAQYFIRQHRTVTDHRKVQTAFRVQLDAEMARPPQFVTNHRNGRKEIVVQDTENTLYLISSTGKIRWKKKLDGPVQGKIHQVDLYRNNKLQLAFTTLDQFLVLDRNGKEVAPFTLRYEGGNLNPLAVFDYEGNKDYRFVVTQGKNVRMYNNKAQIVKGFEFTTAPEDVKGAPQHFRVGKRDYLLFQLGTDQLKILSRRGRERASIKERIPFSENAAKLHKNKFVLTGQNGRLYEISRDGQVKTTAMNLTKEHGMDATSKTLAIMNDNELRIRTNKVGLDLGVYTRPSIFYLNDKIYVSVTDLQGQQVYLFDSQAKPLADFPVFGASSVDMADMDGDKRPELVVGDGEDNLTVYNIDP